jgi:T-complex protein 1 subunit epsilon
MASTSLNSKFVSRCKEHLSSLCVEAVLCVADLERKDVNLDRIKFESMEGGSLEDTVFIKGMVLKKSFSHPQMKKVYYKPIEVIYLKLFIRLKNLPRSRFYLAH